MNQVSPLYRWPQLVPIPPPAKSGKPPFIVVHIPNVSRTASGRATVRSILRSILNQWTDCETHIEETQRGPKAVNPVTDESIFISVSYSKTDAWVALSVCAPIGIDAVRMEFIEEWEAVADLYFGKSSKDKIRHSENIPREFAFRWAAYEAQLKRAGLDLMEQVLPPTSNLCFATVDDTAVAVAWDTQ